MSNNNAKFYARVQSFAHEAAMPEGDLRVVVEWLSLAAPKRQGKASLVISHVWQEKSASEDLRAALALHLTTQLAEVVRARDIAGCTL